MVHRPAIARQGKGQPGTLWVRPCYALLSFTRPCGRNQEGRLPRRLNMASRPSFISLVCVPGNRRSSRILQRPTGNCATRASCTARGKGGRYMLARPADKIFVGEIVHTLDGPLRRTGAPQRLAGNVRTREGSRGIGLVADCDDLINDRAIENFRDKACTDALNLVVVGSRPRLQYAPGCERPRQLRAPIAR
jgi:hypothetical protein